MDRKVEICYDEACGIQSCLRKNDFKMEPCRNTILELQECCKHAQNKSKHCASFMGILAMTKEKPEKLRKATRARYFMRTKHLQRGWEPVVKVLIPFMHHALVVYPAYRTLKNLQKEF